MPTIDELTDEQIAKLVDSEERRKLARKAYFVRNKARIYAYHKTYNARRKQLIAELKARGQFS